MKTKLYKIKPGFAKHQQLPIFFAGTILRETQKAVYMYGKGTVETARMGMCCVCGRELTHPVSVELGIGPICGGHYHNWDLVGGYSIENIAKLKQVVREKVHMDGWIPKSVIKEELETSDIIEIPSNHPLLQIKKEEDSQMKKPVKLATAVTYKETGKPAIKITFPFSYDTVAQVKTLEGRKFNAENKYWICPLSLEALNDLESWGFELDPKFESYRTKQRVEIKDIPNIKVPGLQGELMPFQNKGVSFIEHKDGRALLADEMGLGKTVQALAYLQLHPAKRPVIVVCPASLKLNWKRETEKWLPNPNVQIISGRNFHIPLVGDIIIINYDILSNDYELKKDAARETEIPFTGWSDYLIKIKPQVVIIDECHYIKSNKAKRTKAVKKLAKASPHVIALSGTPIINRPIEMFNPVTIIDSTLFPDFWSFAKKYCGAKHNGFGWDFTGATNIPELHQKLTKSIMVRRLKQDVLRDLPDKTRTMVPLELTNQKEYDSAKTNFINWVKKSVDNKYDTIESALKEELGSFAKKYGIEDYQFGSHILNVEEIEKEKAKKINAINVLTEIEALKQLAVKGKLKAAIEWIKDFLESGEKLVIFANHRFVVDALLHEFNYTAVKLDGSTSMADRDKAVQKFQNDDNIRVFIGNIKAAGVGITLTAASNIVFLELPWTPGELDQAEDRCHRIGQKNAVNIYQLLATETIEEEIAELLDEKRTVLSGVLDGQKVNENSLLVELINKYKS